MTSIEKVNILLLVNGMSGAELCRRIGVSTGVYSQWNKGRNEISKKNLKKIADVFGVSVMELLPDEDNKNTATLSDGKYRQYINQITEMLPLLSEEGAKLAVSAVEQIISGSRTQGSQE